MPFHVGFNSWCKRMCLPSCIISISRLGFSVSCFKDPDLVPHDRRILYGCSCYRCGLPVIEWSQKLRPLFDGTFEVLGVSIEGLFAVGVWFRAKLEDWTRSWKSITARPYTLTPVAWLTMGWSRLLVLDVLWVMKIWMAWSVVSSGGGNSHSNFVDRDVLPGA